MNDDLYKILGVLPEADEKELRSAYRKLAKKYHPDKGRGSSGDKFRAVQHAYEVLTDAQQRAAYDRDRERIPERPRSVPAEWAEYRNAPFSQHIDLRYLSRRQAPEPVDLERRHHYSREDFEAWEDLLAYLFGDF